MTVRLTAPVVTAVAAALIAVSAVLVVTAPTARALNGSQFHAGDIISDAAFYDSTAMTGAQIQAFLNGKVTDCRAGYTCLPHYATATTSEPARPGLCRAYTGRASQSAAQIIADVAVACGINPQVLIVFLQKEQGLVTATAPSSYSYDYAMGANCPTSIGCSAGSAGFFKQVYLAAYQLQYYRAHPEDYNYIAGRNNYILYSPNIGCGGSEVFIENEATASLYIYTPYQPNAAALANLTGAGDACSTYGNRNFWYLFSTWFPSRVVTAPGPPATTSYARTAPASLQPGQRLVSSNGTFELVMQGDGNLVLYSVGRQALWASGTWGHAGAWFAVQADGNLVVYDPGGRPLWNSNTWGNGRAGANRLIMQGDGNLVLYTPAGRAIWASNTFTPLGSHNNPSPAATLTAGRYLRLGQRLVSANDAYRAIMQGDGNFVVYTSSGRATWASGTWGNRGAFLVLQHDGNLVIYGAAGRPLWATGSWGTPANQLILGNDGKLRLYQPNGTLEWHSGTAT